MKEYVLVVATSGAGLTQAVNKLKRELSAESADIEEEIKKDPKTERALETIEATYTKPIDMETVTHHLPRLTVKDLWKESVARCLKRLEESNKPFKILSGHLIYYSGKRNELYSAVDRDCLFLTSKKQIKLKPNGVLLLIDDIYDMYLRLPDLYSTDQIESFFRKLERDMTFDVGRLSNERLSSLTMGWEIRNLLHLLSWRNLEPIMAEDLALQLEARFLVWPVKELIESIKSWLKNLHTIPIYLSHPITEARRQRNETGKWPEFTNEVNQLQEVLSKENITLVMPTGIDELRFQVINEQYTGYLEERWPLVVEDETKLLYSQPDIAQDINHSSLLKPKYWSLQERRLSRLATCEYSEALRSEVNAFLQVFVREIEAQIASRDFLFIYHTNGLIVYRPYYARKPRPTFSGGVDAEVSLWEDIVQLRGQKRIAFVHFKKDVDFALQAKRDKILEEFVDVVWGLLYEKYYTDRNTVENMVKNKGNISEVENILNKTNITQRDKRKIQTEFPKNWKQGKIELLKKYLINIVLPDEKDKEKRQELIGAWVLNDFAALKGETSNIANFLRNGIPKGNKWEDQIESLFPDNFITIQT
jgi:hypothetical protein